MKHLQDGLRLIIQKKTAPGYKNVATIPSRYFGPIDNNMLGVKHLHYARLDTIKLIDVLANLACDKYNNPCLLYTSPSPRD